MRKIPPFLLRMMPSRKVAWTSSKGNDPSTLKAHWENKDFQNCVCVCVCVEVREDNKVATLLQKQPASFFFLFSKGKLHKSKHNTLHDQAKCFQQAQYFSGESLTQFVTELQ